MQKSATAWRVNTKRLSAARAPMQQFLIYSSFVYLLQQLATGKRPVKL